MLSPLASARQQDQADGMICLIMRPLPSAVWSCDRGRRWVEQQGAGHFDIVSVLHLLHNRRQNREIPRIRGQWVCLPVKLCLPVCLSLP